VTESKKPHIKLLLSKDRFNTLFNMLTFFVASEAQAGETFYSFTSAKLMNQFVKYGNFVEKKNESDNLFIIYLYETEVMKITKLYNKYIGVHQKPGKDYYRQFSKSKKSES
jgi:hypothetical protein